VLLLPYLGRRLTSLPVTLRCMPAERPAQEKNCILAGLIRFVLPFPVPYNFRRMDQHLPDQVTLTTMTEQIPFHPSRPGTFALSTIKPRIDDQQTVRPLSPKASQRQPPRPRHPPFSYPASYPRVEAQLFDTFNEVLRPPLKDLQSSKRLFA
jgi:hypothetical protein